MFELKNHRKEERLGTVGIASQTSSGMYSERWKPFHSLIKTLVESDVNGSSYSILDLEPSDDDRTEVPEQYLKEDWNVLKYQGGI